MPRNAPSCTPLTRSTHSDPDIQRSWLHTVNPANDIVRIEESLATMTNLDPEIREKAERFGELRMMSLLSENSQTCQSSSITAPVTLPLIPTYETVKQINVTRSGWISRRARPSSPSIPLRPAFTSVERWLRALVFSTQKAHPPTRSRSITIQIGPLQFRNCMVGVSDTPFPGRGRLHWHGCLCALPDQLSTFRKRNWRSSRFLTPLMSRRTLCPETAISRPSLRSYTPVYHKNQYLLVPVMIDKKDRGLFVLDTGIRLSTMTPEVAHSVSGTRLNFTNSVTTVSGSKLQIYRDSFDLQFANLSLDHKDHILEFDPSTIEQNAGMEVAGMLGFDILQSLVIHIDYRDGLVGFDSPVSTLAPAEVASSQYRCASFFRQRWKGLSLRSVCEPKRRS